MPGINQDRRSNPRRALKVPLVCRTKEKAFWGVTEDLCAGGLFLRSHCPPDLEEALEIDLPDPRAGKAMALRGRVVHRRERNQAALLGEEPPRPAGAGVAFEGIESDQRDRLDSLLSQETLPPPAAPSAENPGDEAGAAEREGFSNVLEDSERVRSVMEGLCRMIGPVRLRRLGGQVQYTTYLRQVAAADSLCRVEAEPVRLKDFDSAFSEKVPFVFLFEWGGHSYAFSVPVLPQDLSGPWGFPLPSRLLCRTDRRSTRLSNAITHPLTVEFPNPSCASLHRVKCVLDIAFGGLAFKNNPGEEIYSPGQILTDMKVCDFDHVCWKTTGVVKHTTFVCPADGEVFQKVGIQFVEEGASAFEEISFVKECELEVIEEAESILKHLERVASKCVVILTGLNHSILFSDGQLRAERRNGGLELTVISRLLSQSPESQFTEARVTYHYLYDGTYHFFSARTKKQNGLFCLEMPVVIHRVMRRRFVRFQPKGLIKARFRCFHPVLGRSVTLPIRDFSIRGLSFESDYTRDIFWRGIRLRSCEILLDGEYYPIGSAEVRALVQRVTENGDLDRSCGVEFLDLPAETERRLSAFLLPKSNPQVRALEAEKIEKLWALFNRSGFIYPSKEAYIRKIRPEIDKTWKKLLSDDTPFYKQLVFREGEEELGTASAVQVYEDTWLLQHLAASSHPVKMVPKYVMLGLAQFLIENREIRYLVTYFRKENSFPRKMYSGFLERYPLEDQLRFSRHSYLSLDLEGQAAFSRRKGNSGVGPAGGIVIGHATDADKEIIENYFQKSLHPLQIRSRSLTRDSLHLPQTSELFRARGLKRERSCLIASQMGTLVAFALMENSSLGINLSGLLNTFSLYTVCPPRERARDARRRLLEAVFDCYRSWGARVAICLTEEEDLTDYLDAGLVKEKEYVCLSWSRRTYKNYYDYVQERFGRIEGRRQRTSTEFSPR